MGSAIALARLFRAVVHPIPFSEIAETPSEATIEPYRKAWSNALQADLPTLNALILFLFVPLDCAAQTTLLLDFPDFLVARTEVEDSVELARRLHRSPEALQIHRAIDR
jgi:hypothetical protein